jgi:hypothetical protein
MNQSGEPKTVEQFLALPVAGFGVEERMIDGVMRRVPIAPNLVAFFCADDTVMSSVDEDGRAWTLARHADGGWCRI